ALRHDVSLLLVLQVLFSGKDSPPTWRAQATFFWLRTMTLDLKKLILIPATSHSAANSPSACCSSFQEGASRTTSSAKSRDEIH
ncbi:hypothetical protein CHARACLAT_028171, partial [Characodon lateralis]|nr:hypothetical protein [Characodon lateralis]